VVYQPVVQYPAVTQPVPLNPADQVPPVFAESWVQPFSEPVLPIEYRYLIESFFGQTLLDSLHVVSTLAETGWFQPLSEPMLPVEYRYQLESYFGQTLLENLHVPPVFAESWGQPWLQLILATEYRYQLESFFGQTLEESLYPIIVIPEITQIRPLNTGAHGILSGQNIINPRGL